MQLLVPKSLLVTLLLNNNSISNDIKQLPSYYIHWCCGLGIQKCYCRNRLFLLYMSRASGGKAQRLGLTQQVRPGVIWMITNMGSGFCWLSAGTSYLRTNTWSDHAVWLIRLSHDWWLSSRREHPKRTRKSCVMFSDVASEVIHITQLSQTQPVSRGENISLTYLWEECHIVGRACMMGRFLWLILENTVSNKSISKLNTP